MTPKSLRLRSSYTRADGVEFEALARLRPLAILDGAIRGDKDQPSDRDLGQIGKDVLAGKTWDDVFQGAAKVEIITDGVGPSLCLRIEKKEGIPVQLVTEATPDASVVGVKRVNELGFYNLGAKQLAEKVGLTMPKTVAVVDALGMRDDPDYYKEFRIGSSLHKRYSRKAIDTDQACSENVLEEICAISDRLHEEIRGTEARD